VSGRDTQADVYTVYQQRVQPKLDEYSKKTPRQRFEKNSDYNEFRNLVWVRCAS